LLGGVGLPIPEDLALLTAGYLVWRGDASPLAFGVLAFVAVACSDVTLFAIGHHPWLSRNFRGPRAERIVAAYRRHGAGLVLLGRVAIGVRALLMLGAGFSRVSVGKFLLADLLGLACMVVLWMHVGYWLGPRLEPIRPWLAHFDLAIAAILIGLVIWRLRRPVRSSPRPVKEASEPLANR
jgi:membrane protein DedA with SNARE-associated domain